MSNQPHLCYKCKLAPVDHHLRGGTCHACWLDKIDRCFAKSLSCEQENVRPGGEIGLVAVIDAHAPVASSALAQALRRLSPHRRHKLKAAVIIGQSGKSDHLQNVDHYIAPSLGDCKSYNHLLQRRFAIRVTELLNAQLLLLPQSATIVAQETLRRFFLGQNLRAAESNSVGVISPLRDFNDEELLAYVSLTTFDKPPPIRSNADTLEKMEKSLSEFVKESLTSFPSALPNIEKMTRKLQPPETGTHDLETGTRIVECLLCLQRVTASCARRIDTEVLCRGCEIAAKDAYINSVELTLKWIYEQAEEQVSQKTQLHSIEIPES